MPLIQRLGHQCLEWIQIAGLFVVALATILAIGHQIMVMWQVGLVSLADLLLLFIFLEVLAMVAMYLKEGKLPIRVPIYIAIVALARYLILTSFARIPSMIGNALGGSMLGRQNYRAAMITMAVVVLISLIVFFVYRNHERRKAAAAPLPPAQTGESDEPDKKGTSDV